MGELWIIIIATVIVGGAFLLRTVIGTVFDSLWDRGADAIERKIWSGKAGNEDDQLGTVLTFVTYAPASHIQHAVASEIPTDQPSPKNGLFGRRYLVLQFNDQQGMGWYGGKQGDTFAAELSFGQGQSGATEATYFVTKHEKHGGVSSCVEVMSDLRDCVVRAFQRLDPNVYIQASQQAFQHQSSWH